MIINTVKEHLTTHCNVKDAMQLARETGLAESTCRWMMNKPQNTVSDRILDILCKRYGCTVGDLKRYVPDNVTVDRK
jgi:DNA-binding Xre family transcriptional regulator